jgi:hypothetical protein
MATIHARGAMKFPGGETAELEAYVDRKGAADRALIQFRSGPAFRSLGLVGNVGFERDESGVYRRVEGEALDDLRSNATALLLASRFPIDGIWERGAGDLLLRKEDAVEVELDAAALPTRIRFPGPPAARRECRYSSWRVDQGIRFPGTLEFVVGATPAWTLQIETWDPQAVVVDALFEPPCPHESTSRPETASRPK